MRPFYIGLNMTGAVSAGAYTAGVVDFLIDALDSFMPRKLDSGNGLEKTTASGRSPRMT